MFLEPGFLVFNRISLSLSNLCFFRAGRGGILFLPRSLSISPYLRLGISLFSMILSLFLNPILVISCVVVLVLMSFFPPLPTAMQTSFCLGRSALWGWESFSRLRTKQSCASLSIYFVHVQLSVYCCGMQLALVDPLA